MLNLPATISLTAAALGLLFASLTVVVASAPGLRDIRMFGASCLFGALYAVLSATMALPVSPAIGEMATRAALTVAGLHTSSWLAYRVRRERRSTTTFEKVQLVVLVAVAFGALIPGLYVRGPWHHEIPMLGAVYQEGRATWIGGAAMALDCLAVLRLFLRAFARLRTGNRTDRAEVIGLGALLATAAHDTLVSLALVPTPYLLDLGYLVLVVAMTFALTKHFVERSLALEASSLELARTQEELVARERLVALGEMSAVVAHEVRNPLGVIFNAVASLKRRGATDEQRQLLRIVEEEAERLKRMVSDLLHFAQPRRLTAADVTAEAMVVSAVDAARASLGVADEEVAIDLPSGATLHCDDRLIRQAIVNLVTNAIQANGRRSPVQVAVRFDDGAALIVVTDDGEGVAKDIVGDVFRPFFTTRASGTGLGLSVVRKIVEAHGGTIALSETPGGGATFTMRLPDRSVPREEAA